MTALTNSASDGNSVLEPNCDDRAGDVDLSHVREPASDPESQPDPDAWRQEVTARLARYRTRRKPRAPRYPSLFLPFDSSDNWTRASALSDSQEPFGSPNEASRPAEVSEPLTILEDSEQRSDWEQLEHQSDVDLQLEDEQAPEASAKVIEFPRSAAIPIVHFTPLADPVFDRPRIVEAPEMVPAAPALGGILIETQQADAAAGASQVEPRIPCAPISRRLLAAATDGVILAVSLCAFGAVFVHFNPVAQFPAIREWLPRLAIFGGGLAVLLWMCYQLVFVGGIGTTPGMRAAGLRLARFDGSSISRRARCWRVLASFLSAFSAGLGYLWCFLDEDALCWHDRITRTSLQSTRRDDSVCVGTQSSLRDSIPLLGSTRR